MKYYKLIGCCCIMLLVQGITNAQTRFSLATDFSVQRSLKKQQRYWAAGQTIAGQFHFTPTDGVYVWGVYYTNGKFNDQLVATSKTPIVQPAEISYENNAELVFRHGGLGWKHYFKGTALAEQDYSIYGYGGFGILFGRVMNKQSTTIDTSFYTLPVLPGNANFKRLTFDLGIGVEVPLAGGIYAYGEGRTFIPASDYPSRYLLINNNAPFSVSVNGGLRILF